MFLLQLSQENANTNTGLLTECMNTDKGSACTCYFKDMTTGQSYAVLAKVFIMYLF